MRARATAGSAPTELAPPISGRRCQLAAHDGGDKLQRIGGREEIDAVPDGAFSSLVDAHMAILPARLFKSGTLHYAAIQPTSPGIGENRDRTPMNDATPPNRCRIVLIAPPGACWRFRQRGSRRAFAGGDVASLILPPTAWTKPPSRRSPSGSCRSPRTPASPSVIAGDTGSPAASAPTASMSRPARQNSPT